MPARQNAELVRHYFDDSNTVKGDIARFRDIWKVYFAPVFVAHYSTGDMDYDQYLKYGSSLHAAFQDLKQTVEDIVAQGDKVVVRLTLQGTHTGVFGGINATGRSVSIQAVLIIRMSNSKFVEVWAFPNEMGLLRQLGVIPEGALRR